MMERMLTTGFQATNVGLAIQEIDKMVPIIMINRTIDNGANS